MASRKCVKCGKYFSNGTRCPYCGKDNFNASDAGKTVAKKALIQGAKHVKPETVVNVILKILGL